MSPTLTNGTNFTDTEKGSTAYASSTTGEDHRVESAKAERRLLFKLDILIMPLAVLLYLSAYLDRGNLGNARLQGLEATVLKGSDANYSLALSCFFITYIVLSIPGTLLAKAIQPSTSIATGALIWSIAATCQSAAFNPAGLYVARLFVGVGEALFGQAMALYFTYWYLPTEVAKRVGLFISAGSLSGAFGGLISYGVSSIKHSAITQWKILFLIEGGFTDGHAQFTDWKTYVVAIAYSCMNLGLGSVGGYLPTNVVALVFMLLITTYSDRYQTRGIPIASVFCIGIVGWAILFAVSPIKASHMALRARYFGCIAVVTAGYSNIPLIISWQSANTGSQSQRAVSLGMLNTVGQCLSVLAAYSFPKSEGPRFIKGNALNIAFSSFGLLITLAMTAYYRYENKRRDAVEGGRPPKGTTLNVLEHYDLAEGFRYTA
ncbi:hypothetical protein RQP46_001967 [Phenoliferia psychrophenolica]